MNIRFEELKEQDLPVVKEIYDWYIANSTATFHTEPITIEALKDIIYFNHPYYKAYLIYANNSVSGYCFVTYFKKRQAYDRTAEVTLYLKPEFHRKGIGSLALEFLEKDAKANGLKNMIGIITGENTSSINLFEKMGYSKCAHYKNVGEKFGRILDVVAYQKEI